MPNNITETTITGKKFRVWDSVNNIWKRISYWTKASDVEMNDGSTLEQKISDIEDEIDERTEDAVFDSYQDYLDAYNQGEVPVGTVVYIKDDNNGTVTALQVSYGSTNVGAVLDTLGTPSQASGVTGNTAFAKINTLNTALAGNDYVEVTGNGSKTYKQLLNELHALASKSKLNKNSVLEIIPSNNNIIYLPFTAIENYSGTYCVDFGCVTFNGTVRHLRMDGSSSSAVHINFSGGGTSYSYISDTNTAVEVSTKFRLIY